MKINENYSHINESYLFSKVNKRINDFKAANAGCEVIRLSIGDVTRPLTECVVEAMSRAALEMGSAETFRGYGPEQGYDFLLKAIEEYYRQRNIFLNTDEIFVSDGAKSDLGNILDLFDKDNTVCVPDPVYPVYVDTNVMAGRKIVYMEGNSENGFLPMPSRELKADIIYLCSPNNPTGAVYTKEQLEEWIDYARKNNALILFDAAYEAFVTQKELPRSIYELEGAKECAIEFCSFSKTAGFTGTRCGYTIVPKTLSFSGMSLNKMWLRRQTTKFNGVAYIVQRGAEAALSEKGIESCRKNIGYYLENAKLIAETLDEMNIWYTGGKNSPYIWLKCPGNMNSWDYFDFLLNKIHIAGTPGEGFGKCGEGFLRLTAFGAKENVITAMDRLRKM